MPLIVPCAQCGRKNLSFSLYDGICQKCINANNAAQQRLRSERHQAELSNAEMFYQNLVFLWNKTGACWTANKYRSLAAAKETLADCDSFISELKRIPTIACFSEAFSSHCAPSVLGSYENKDFGYQLKISQTDSVSFVADFDGLLWYVNRRKQLAEKTIAASREFSSYLQNIPLCDISIDLSRHPSEKTVSLLLESKNITARTPLSKLNPFFVIDVETTGLNPISDEIISLSAIRFDNFEPVSAFSTFIKPRCALKDAAQQINGIVDSDIENAPYIETVVSAFSRFVSPDPTAKKHPPIVGHNISFDYKFLQANGIYLFDRDFYDTLEISKRQYKDESSYKLDELSQSVLHISRTDAHTSLSDALVTGLLFKKICKERIEF